jgi:hypothetical protein
LLERAGFLHLVSGDEEVRNANNQEPEREEEKLIPPKQIDDVGDEAYCVSNRFGGVLYVLKWDAFISIGLGGTGDEETRLTKSKARPKSASVFIAPSHADVAYPCEIGRNRESG